MVREMAVRTRPSAFLAGDALVRLGCPAVADQGTAGFERTIGKQLVAGRCRAPAQADPAATDSDRRRVRPALDSAQQLANIFGTRGGGCCAAAAHPSAERAYRFRS